MIILYYYSKSSSDNQLILNINSLSVFYRSFLARSFHIISSFPIYPIENLVSDIKNATSQISTISLAQQFHIRAYFLYWFGFSWSSIANFIWGADSYFCWVVILIFSQYCDIYSSILSPWQCFEPFRCCFPQECFVPST